MSHNAKFHSGQLSGFIGWTIDANVLDEENNRFGLLVSNGVDEIIIWIDKDFEGSDHGAVFLQEMENKDAKNDPGS